MRNNLLRRLPIWYFPLIWSAKTAGDMRWHAEKGEKEGKRLHPHGKHSILDIPISRHKFVTRGLGYVVMASFHSGLFFPPYTTWPLVLVPAPWKESNLLISVLIPSKPSSPKRE